MSQTQKSNGTEGELKRDNLKPPLPMGKISPRTSTVRQGLVKDRSASGSKYRKQQNGPSRIQAPSGGEKTQAPSGGGKSVSSPFNNRQARPPRGQSRQATDPTSPRMNRGISENASSKRPHRMESPRTTKGVTKSEATIASPRTAKLNDETTARRKPPVPSPSPTRAKSDEVHTRRQSGMPSPRTSKQIGICRPNLKNSGVKSPKITSGNSKVMKKNGTIPKDMSNDNSTPQNGFAGKNRHADEENNNLEFCLPDLSGMEQDKPHEDTNKVGNHFFSTFQQLNH